MMDQIFSTKEAADWLRASERTLERLRVTGDGPKFCRIGPRRVVYRAADLAEWLEARAFQHRAAELAAAPQNV